MSLSVSVREQRLVRLQRILDLDLRAIAVAAECAHGSVGLQSVTRKLSMRSERAFDLLADGSGHGDGDRAWAGRRRARVRRARRRRRSPSGSAASWLRAFSCRSPSGRRSANGSCCTSPRSMSARPPHRRRARWAAACRSPAARPALVAVATGRCGCIRRPPCTSSSGSGSGGIPSLCARAADDRENQLARLIVQHDRRSEQVRPARHTAAQIRPVARTAVGRARTLSLAR